jgi:hypothetical protein
MGKSGVGRLGQSFMVHIFDIAHCSHEIAFVYNMMLLLNFEWITRNIS